MNGAPLGAGPGRSVGGAVALDTYNVTALLRRAGPNVLAVEAYYGPRPKGRNDSDDVGGVLAVVHDGTGTEHGAEWRAFDATPAFRPTLCLFGAAGCKGGDGAGTGSYAQPHENIDARAYPQGWRGAGYDDAADDGWGAAAGRAAFADGVAAKRAMPVALRDVAAVRFDALPSPAGSFRYVVDFGRELQGHVNISFASGAAGREVVVRLGEQLLANGSVRWQSLTHNQWSDTWTLAAGEQSFVPHEYCEFRWAEVIGAPEPPTPARVRGWAVHYPFDGELGEGGATTTGVRGLTEFSSSDPGINAVWGLVKHTIVAASLDLNTDSNTRQRDLCTLDAYLATRYQGGIAPASAYHLRRRVTQFMFEEGGYVNSWTEFLTSHVGALHAFTTDFADTSLAAAVWDFRSAGVAQLPVPCGGDCAPRCAPLRCNTCRSCVGPAEWSMANYSLAAYYSAADRLVRRTPKPLTDWPRSELIDIDEKAAARCADVCASMNAHAVTAQGRMADLAARIGRGVEAAAYAARRDELRAAAHAAFATSACSPAAPLCYADTPGGAETTAQSAAFAAPAHIVPRWLMGVRPLADGWRAVTVRPLPPRHDELRTASVTLPTLRGTVAAAFDSGPAAFALNLTIPGNTWAEVCLPAYVLRGAPSARRAVLDGAAAPAALRGGLLCLTDMVGSGEHVATLH